MFKAIANYHKVMTAKYMATQELRRAGLNENADQLIQLEYPAALIWYDELKAIVTPKQSEREQ